MKLSELNALEKVTLDELRSRCNKGDNEAARVLLEHIDRQRERISQWQAGQQASRRPDPRDEDE